jgi:hypothetical protein
MTMFILVFSFVGVMSRTDCKILHDTVSLFGVSFGSVSHSIGCQIATLLMKFVIILVTEETHFHLSGYVNKQNFPYWAEENPPPSTAFSQCT